jgi:hypothetical protein
LPRQHYHLTAGVFLFGQHAMQSAPACTALVFLLFIITKEKPPCIQVENSRRGIGHKAASKFHAPASGFDSAI